MEIQADGMPSAGLLTYEEAARELGIAVVSVKQAISRGALHPVRLPHQQRKYLRRDEVEAYHLIAKRGRPRLKVDKKIANEGEMHARDVPEPSVVLPDELSLILRVALETARDGWQANAAAVQHSASLHQQAIAANARSITETVLGIFDRYLSLKHETGDMSSRPPGDTPRRKHSFGTEIPRSQGDYGDVVQPAPQYRTGRQLRTTDYDELMGLLDALLRRETHQAPVHSPE